MGEVRDGRGVANLERHRQDGGPSGRRKGSDVPMKPGNAGEGRALMTTSEEGWAALSRDKVGCAATLLVNGVLEKKERSGDWR